MSHISAKNLKEIIKDRFNGNNAVAERELGLPKNYIYRLLPNSKNEEPATPSSKFINKIYDLGYNIDWLLFDKGNKKRDISTSSVSENSETYNPSGRIELKGVYTTITIPVVGKISAGFPTQNSYERIGNLMIPIQTPKDTFALIVDGDSMADAMRDGDYVLFTPFDGNLKSGDIIAVADEYGSTMVKRYRIIDSVPHACSDNQGYRNFVLNNGYRIIGKALPRKSVIRFVSPGL